MTARKKSAIGLWISGSAFIGMGTVLWTTSVTPSWVGIGINILGLVGTALGYVLTLPKVD